MGGQVGKTPGMGFFLGGALSPAALTCVPCVNPSFLLRPGDIVSILAVLSSLSSPRRVVCRQPGQWLLFVIQHCAAPLESGGRRALAEGVL